MKMNRKRTWIAVLSCLLLLVMDAVLTVLYFKTKYLPLLLAAEMLMLPAFLNLILLCFGRDVRVPQKHLPEIPSETPETDAALNSGEENASLPKKEHRFARLGQKIRNLPHAIASGYNRIRRILVTVLLFALILLFHLLIWGSLGRVTSLYRFTYLEPLLTLLSFILCLVLGKWCRFEKKEDGNPMDAILDNLSSVLALQQLVSLFFTAVFLLSILANYDAQKIAVWVVAILLCYETVFMLISFAVRSIRREFDDAPDIGIPIPFSGQTKDMGVLGYLEKNTGITMRSLWSIRLIKQILPYALMAGVALFWLSTGVVQIESQQMGAHYRLGRLQEKPLAPGLHLTLPWPFDRVDIYDTETVNKITVGYSSTQNQDNTWTGNHGNSEYKLLMGSGDELCSINLRVEYKISDLNAYVRTATAPAKLLESKSYELIMERTVETSLDELLSVDRSAFAESFKAQLISEMNAYNVGVEVVSVVLESIHPPVEVAAIYQQLIGAEVDAQRYIYDAEGLAITTVEEARKKAFSAEQKALAEKHKAVAAARSDVSEFMASVEADKVNSSAYRYYKYLEALTKAYGKGKLVIVGDGVDTSDIYFGNLTALMN